MNELSIKELDYQYAKIVAYLNSHNDKLKKYRNYKSSLQSTISDGIKTGRYNKSDFPSLTIETKQSEKVPISESLIGEFLETIYSSKPIRELFISKLTEFRKDKARLNPPSISIKLNQ